MRVCVRCVCSYISVLLGQPGEPLHQVRDEDDVHYVGKQRRPAGERHQLLPQGPSVTGVDGHLGKTRREENTYYYTYDFIFLARHGNFIDITFHTRGKLKVLH